LEKKLLAMPKPKIIVCIPARYGSTRFPGKVLAKDTGKFLIQHVYEQAKLAKLPNRVIIAADDKRIADAAKSFGAECIMTSPDCPSGTDRIAEAIQKLSACPERTCPERSRESRRAERFPPVLSEVEGLNADDIVINLQADEPEIDPANIDAVAKLLAEGPKCQMATLVADFETKEQIADPNIVKVVCRAGFTPPFPYLKTQNSKLKTDCGIAIYFSRSVIPYDREQGGIGPKSNYLRHLGIYAYRKDFLLKITKLPQTPLEKIEKLEQLRAVESGFDILVAKVKHTCAGIDTPDQYAEFVKRYAKTKQAR
jgi:3-deoxy-manno-octulosonate cytidylyltransferase (CMP-KDO synthetase)